jgi:hypothetical protein
MSITYVNPPASKRGRRGYSEQFIEELRADQRVGEWALLRSGLKSGTSVHSLRKRYPDCEFTTRRQDDGLYSFYVRLAVQENVQNVVHTIATFDPSDDM